MRYDSTDWSLEIPKGWNYRKDSSCTTFWRPGGVGAFQISSYRKDEAVTDADLREFAGETTLIAVSFGRLTGFRARLRQKDRFWSKWWLRAGRQMIHVTYNSALSEHGSEDTEVNAMLESLIPVHE